LLGPRRICLRPSSFRSINVTKATAPNPIKITTSILILHSIITIGIKSLISQVWELRTPKNISYMWGFGRFLGTIIVVQIASGFLLAFYYRRGVQAWEAMIEISREVRYGWVLRLVHGNTASFVFVVLFLHFFRGIIYASFYLTFPWLRGWVIMFITIAAAFLGYVLPWGQISFWGATVIINLLRILPIGKILVIWLWGGFYVSSFTCSFFYALHFILPLLILVVAGIHLILLHTRGSSTPGGVRASSSLKIKFRYLFAFKDLVNIRILWFIWIWALTFPDWSADPVNFVVSDLSNSPLHIQPEWYFLHLYAILRSIPSKLGGLIGFGLALVLLTALSLVFSSQRVNHLFRLNFLTWSFVWVNCLLIWLGMQPVEAPYILMGQLFTFVYFRSIVLVICLDELLVINLWRVIPNCKFGQKFFFKAGVLRT